MRSAWLNRAPASCQSSATAGITSRPSTSIGRISSAPTTQPSTVWTHSEASQRNWPRSSGTLEPSGPTSNPKGAVFSIAP